MAIADSDLARNVKYCYGLGWSFTPLVGKRPILHRWQVQAREMLEQALAWAAEGNVGLRTGKASGIIVIDADIQKGADIASLDLPGTVTGYTGGGGMHLLYLCTKPLGNSVGKLGKFIDVRADGGQVVFPGSIHPDTGEPYTWAPGYEPWTIAVAELPDPIYDLLVAPRRTDAAPVADSPAALPAQQPQATTRHPMPSRHERYARTALLLEVRAVGMATEGTRNDRLNQAAFNLGQFIGAGVLDRTVVEAELRQAALGVGLELQEVEATLRSGLDAGQKQPRDLKIEDRAKRKTKKPTTATPAVIPASPVPSPANLGAEDLQHYRWTDLGNAERFVAEHGDHVRFCPAWGCWLLWDGTRWRRDEKLGVEELAKDTVRGMLRAAAEIRDDAMRNGFLEFQRKCESAAKMRAMMITAQSRLAVHHSDLDRDGYLLNVLNGTIDLRTGELQQHRQLDMITKLAPVNYNPDADCPMWMDFLEEIFAGDAQLIRFVQRFLGYALSGDTEEHVLPIFYGTGSNGKSTLIDTVLHILGEYGCKAPESLFTAHSQKEHPVETATLQGRRLAVGSETEGNARLRISKLKELTGDRYLEGRFMYQNNFTFERTSKLVLLTNHKPHVPDDTDAAWRRLRLVPFNVQFLDRPGCKPPNKDLPEKLNEETTGILAWLVDGFTAWWTERTLTDPDAVQQATLGYRTDEDGMTRFLAACIIGQGGWTSTEDLRRTYEDITGEHWTHKITPQLQKLGCEPRRGTLEQSQKVVRGWSNIILR